jgi:aerobic C4-dicarboxylate transport protein
MAELSQPATAASRPIYRSLYFQVLVAIALGVILGHFFPETGAKMKPLGDGFIKLIKMLIAPIIFCTVVSGISGMENMKSVGKTGALALLYFEVVSSIALIIGLIVVNVVEPGVGMNVDVATLDASGVQSYAQAAQSQNIVDFCSRCCSASRCIALASAAVAFRSGSTVSRTYCSASSTSSCASRRSVRSARWRSRSASTACRRWRPLGS